MRELFLSLFQPTLAADLSLRPSKARVPSPDLGSPFNTHAGINRHVVGEGAS